ncbi:MAG: hypothetical protein NWE98_10905 [Candidatus Bathyarchaeota archaeon]|nr:hypothetical protein [Candidatus Bathyarchaeota archaeon]
MLANGENLQVYLADNQLNYTVTSGFDSWIFTFNCSHSTHEINMHLASNSSSKGQPVNEIILIAIIAVLSTVLAIEIHSWLKPKDKQKT